MIILIVAAIILISGPSEPVPDMLDFTFMDHDGNSYRSTKLLDYAGTYEESDKQPMILLIETPNINNPDFKKQYEEIRKLALSDANIITVVSCPVEEYDSSFHTDVATAASIRNNSKSFRVMLLDGNGKVRKHWFKSAKSEALEKLIVKTANIDSGTDKEEHWLEKILALNSSSIKKTQTVH
jgi:hypothetical protein